MADPIVRGIVEARIVANWAPATDGRCLVFQTNVEGEPPASGIPFLKVQYPVQMAGQITVGAPGNELNRDSGGIRFVLAVPAGDGTEPFLTWMKDLRTLFKTYQEGNFQTFVPSPVTEDDENAKDGWFVMSSSVEYQFDTFG